MANETIAVRAVAVLAVERDVLDEPEIAEIVSMLKLEHQEFVSLVTMELSLAYWLYKMQNE